MHLDFFKTNQPIAITSLQGAMFSCLMNVNLHGQFINTHEVCLTTTTVWVTCDVLLTDCSVNNCVRVFIV